ncbi:MAG: ABC transporter permease subunit [Devosia nanyangense]|uniref:ABC transporter permease subunit n=1 Tax=Devosia nanyangense TaxID=1228055 RepID=A0A933NXV0_9HYPH|nr:ABC transporter permease subunit [Devosia nanyangense]
MTATALPAAAPRRPWTLLRRWLAAVGLSGRALVIAAPALWLTLFFLIPLGIVLQVSLSESAIAIPPYLPLITSELGTVQMTLHLSNFIRLFQDKLYILAYLNSIKIAAISTIFALLIGYPIAYFIARSSDRWRNVLLMLIILPFWSSFLLRVYAWIGFLKNEGVINNFLEWTGLIHAPIPMIQTDFAVYVGIVYTYLPFMILPLYTNLVKLDESLLEASADLGARPIRTFLSITLPLSIPGIVAGSMLVFIPAIGEFVIPSLLGGPGTLMIGRVLFDEFFSNRDWPMASALAFAMLLVVVVPIMVMQSAQSAVVTRK